jgi:hypothetical protein
MNSLEEEFSSQLGIVELGDLSGIDEVTSSLQA